jgi:hypothetical protein
MSLFLIVPKERVSEMDDINSGFSDRVSTTTETIDGVLLTNADKLEDTYWKAYHDFLSSLSAFTGQPIWPTPPEALPE